MSIALLILAIRKFSIFIDKSQNLKKSHSSIILHTSLFLLENLLLIAYVAF